MRTRTAVEPDEEFGSGGDVLVLDEMEIKVGVGSGVLEPVDGRGGGEESTVHAQRRARQSRQRRDVESSRAFALKSVCAFQR